MLNGSRPRVMILHAGLGSGHATAARALAAAFTRLGVVDLRVADTLDFAGKLLRDALVQAYLDLSTQAPALWKLLYERADIDKLPKALVQNRLRARLERPLLADLDAYVNGFAPDAIVCTHMLPADLLQLRVARGTLPARVHCVVTDFMVHSTWIVEAADHYYLASELTRRAMQARGVPDRQLHVTGIPVAPAIAEPKSPAEARARHDLPATGPLVTLFGGGMQPERVRLLAQLLVRAPLDGTLVLSSGRSEDVAVAVADLEAGPRCQLRRFGRVDFVDDLVTASDIVVTKSGGLTVSEVLARGRPMVIIDPIPGQEDWNADAVAAFGAGIQLRHLEMVPEAVLALLSEPARLAALGEGARRAGRPRAALDIAAAVLGDLATRPTAGSGLPALRAR